jgi:hypothetical protein
MDLPDKSLPQAPKKNITPVVSGVVQVKRPATRRFMDFVFQESPKELTKRVGRDVIAPRFKAGIEEALNSFIAGMMWGDGANRPISNVVRGTVLRGGGVNYSAVSQGPQSLMQARQANETRSSSGNYQDLIMPTQQTAELVLANMYELLNQYRVVAVADLYELAEITPAPSDNSYGWTSFDGARIRSVGNGYVLELPRPSLIG